ncbi:hypothetical protein [Mycoplasma tauri]|uniref:hypothetical protein n=1 Tax=Mycoplasma tauri TaxID=547987 RepID=UPI001CBEF788|nr:hypothetical protein [Mycoplasma tauri]MBZ4204246.1 hypothetical protein [Mycoplasma tauri]
MSSKKGLILSLSLIPITATIAIPIALSVNHDKKTINSSNELKKKISEIKSLINTIKNPDYAEKKEEYEARLEKLEKVSNDSKSNLSELIKTNKEADNLIEELKIIINNLANQNRVADEKAKLNDLITQISEYLVTVNDSLPKTKGNFQMLINQAQESLDNAKIESPMLLVSKRLKEEFDKINEQYQILKTGTDKLKISLKSLTEAESFINVQLSKIESVWDINEFKDLFTELKEMANNEGEPRSSFDSKIGELLSRQGELEDVVKNYDDLSNKIQEAGQLIKSSAFVEESFFADLSTQIQEANTVLAEKNTNKEIEKIENATKALNVAIKTANDKYEPLKNANEILKNAIKDANEFYELLNTSTQKDEETINEIKNELKISIDKSVEVSNSKTTEITKITSTTFELNKAITDAKVKLSSVDTLESLKLTIAEAEKYIEELNKNDNYSEISKKLSKSVEVSKKSLTDDKFDKDKLQESIDKLNAAINEAKEETKKYESISEVETRISQRIEELKDKKINENGTEESKFRKVDYENVSILMKSKFEELRKSASENKLNQEELNTIEDFYNAKVLEAAKKILKKFNAYDDKFGGDNIFNNKIYAEEFPNKEKYEELKTRYNANLEAYRTYISSDDSSFNSDDHTKYREIENKYDELVAEAEKIIKEFKEEYKTVEEQKKAAYQVKQKLEDLYVTYNNIFVSDEKVTSNPEIKEQDFYKNYSALLAEAKTILSRDANEVSGDNNEVVKTNYETKKATFEATLKKLEDGKLAYETSRDQYIENKIDTQGQKIFTEKLTELTKVNNSESFKKLLSDSKGANRKHPLYNLNNYLQKINTDILEIEKENSKQNNKNTDWYKENLKKETEIEQMLNYVIKSIWGSSPSGINVTYGIDKNSFDRTVGRNAVYETYRTAMDEYTKMVENISWASNPDDKNVAFSTKIDAINDAVQKSVQYQSDYSKFKDFANTKVVPNDIQFKEGKDSSQFTLDDIQITHFEEITMPKSVKSGWKTTKVPTEITIDKDKINLAKDKANNTLTISVPIKITLSGKEYTKTHTFKPITGFKTQESTENN